MKSLQGGCVIYYFTISLIFQKFPKEIHRLPRHGECILCSRNTSDNNPRIPFQFCLELPASRAGKIFPKPFRVFFPLYQLQERCQVSIQPGILREIFFRQSRNSGLAASKLFPKSTTTVSKSELARSENAWDPAPLIKEISRILNEHPFFFNTGCVSNTSSYPGKIPAVIALQQGSFLSQDSRQIGGCHDGKMRCSNAAAAAGHPLP